MGFLGLVSTWGRKFKSRKNVQFQNIKTMMLSTTQICDCIFFLILANRRCLIEGLYC